MEKTLILKEEIMETAGAPTRQSKHLAISEAINRLSLARNGLQSLLEEITGQDSPPEEKTAGVGSTPSMLSFLNETESEISKITDDLNRIRDELHGALF